MGMNSASIASSNANDARKKADALERQLAEVTERLLLLEEAMCGLCQSIGPLSAQHTQMRNWFIDHINRPGCEFNKGEK